jgi:hypothetical protein
MSVVRVNGVRSILPDVDVTESFRAQLPFEFVRIEPAEHEELESVRLLLRTARRSRFQGI